MDNITNEKLRSLFKPITITQSHQKNCGKDGDHPQGAFIKLGGKRSPLSLIPHKLIYLISIFSP